MSDSLPSEINVAEAYGRRKSDPDTLFLDVREPSELALCHLEPDLHISIRSLADRWQEVPTDRPIIVYCHHGMRSLHATHLLRDRGISQVQSMAGGIEAWSLEIDPAIPRY